jgi:hypothetical protein
MKEAASGFGLVILDTTVNKRAAYVETALEGKGVYESGDAKAKEEMINLTTEVLAHAKALGLVK